MSGHPPADLPENVATWMIAQSAELCAEDVAVALQAIERVAGEDSVWPSCGT
jgi:hypothetical protein